MEVQIDETGQNVHPGDVVLFRPRLRTVLGIDWDAGNADTGDPRDAIPLDHDVDRPARRPTGPVDHDRTAQYQPVEGALAFIGSAVRRWLYHLLRSS